MSKRIIISIATTLLLTANISHAQTLKDIFRKLFNDNISNTDIEDVSDSLNEQLNEESHLFNGEEKAVISNPVKETSANHSEIVKKQKEDLPKEEKPKGTFEYNPSTGLYDYLPPQEKDKKLF